MKFAALYLLVGLFIPERSRPFRFNQNWWMTLLLWPWPIAAVLVHKVTGRWPTWTPP